MFWVLAESAAAACRQVGTSLNLQQARHGRKLATEAGGQGRLGCSPAAVCRCVRMHIVAPTWCSLLPAAAAFIALHPPSTWLLHRLCCCCCCRRRLLRSSVIGTEQSSSPCRSRRLRRKCVFQGAGEGLERKRERERDRGKKSLRGSLHCIAFQQLCWS